MEVETRVDDEELLHCVVEIPKGSRNKYEWGDFEQLEDLPSQLRDEIQWLFSMYKTPEVKAS